MVKLYPGLWWRVGEDHRHEWDISSKSKHRYFNVSYLT